MSELVTLLAGYDWTAVAMMASAAVSGLIVIALLSTSTNREARRQRARYEEIRARARGRPVAATTVTVRRREDGGALDSVFKRLVPHPDRLRKRLHKTGMKITLGHYMMATLVIAVVITFVVWRFGGLPLPIAAMVGLAKGIAFPHLLIGALINRRQSRFTEEFPEGIDVIVRGLRSGLPISETIVAVRNELPGPVGAVFHAVADRLGLGNPVEDAVARVAEDLDTPEFKFFAISLAVQRETGGNLAETLSNLSDILRRRRQMKLKIRALSSEARASAYILSALPFVMFGLLFLVNRGYVMQLFDDARGIAMITGGGFLMMLGGIIMFRMVKFEI